MSGRHDSPAQRAVRGAVITAAGLAGAASLVAFAAPVHAAPSTTTDRTPAADDSTTSAAPTSTAPAIAPNFGLQKLRVGVQSADKAVGPDGKPVDTAGTKLRVTGAGPDGAGGSFECSTVASTPDDPTDATFCPGEFFDTNPFDDGDDRVNVQRANRVVPSPSNGIEGFYTIPAGWTATVEQLTTPTGLRTADPETLPTCTVASDDEACTEPNPDSEGARVKRTDVVLVDPGIAPVAQDDSAKTEQGVAVTIDISDNDTGNAPITKVELAKDAGHGKVALGAVDDAPASASASASESTTPASSAVSSPITLPPLPSITLQRAASARRAAAIGSYQAIYTPNAGFSGTDRFTYRITTANGSATAVVTVRAAASAATTEAAPNDNQRDPIAETGTDSGELLLVGTGLLAVGGAVMTAGVKRRRGRHAR